MFFQTGKKDTAKNIVIITGSCCIPGMVKLDEEAGQLVNQAVAETGVAVRIKLLPVSKAILGGLPKDVYNKLIGGYNSTGRIGLPAVLIDGKLVTYGVVDYESIKTQLQEKYISEIKTRFAGLSKAFIPLLDHEVSEVGSLRDIGRILYGE